MSLRLGAHSHDRLLARRLDQIVPPVMRRAGIDCWVLIAREYNEDPVMSTMLPATWLSARRRTIAVFLDRGDAVERWAVARYPVGDLFPAVWKPDSQPDQWRCLAELIEQADPQRIGVNSSSTFALADGLSASERSEFLAALPASLHSRVVSAERVAIGWLETRLPEEVELMAEACRLAHDLLGRGLSPEAITPGETTTHQLEWWLREAVATAGLSVWFHPTVSVQRKNGEARTSFATRPKDEVIARGDLVHCDFGIILRGLCTDQQQHAYILHPNEHEPPPGLVDALRLANDLQDILMAQFASERTGNQLLEMARAEAAEAGIVGKIYTHPIGLHGHAAGPTIGLWDHQDGVPGPGDYPVYPDTAYSIELLAEVPVPEWDGQTVNIMLEEDAFFDGTSCRFLDDRQTELWVV